MKKYTLLIIILILTSCNFKEKKSELNYPLENIEIKSIELEGSNKNFSDTLILNKFSKSFRELTNKDLVTGERLHGATRICDLKIKTNENDILLFIARSQENEVVVSFFESKKEDNFNYFLGALYETDQLMKMIKNAGIKCKN
ncbi:hypothetical protein ML462_15725 [Gramella lutea]|uniref:Uncharacterized protein n=1 Tax=Christiangramia lutea TaxID=1607951 RepID=A0A9X2ACZ5_9FLAO|nr:hypothetical protein [Christiangramia lutea]MCH4824623.1 hypothetical protein [Christiangramia lutea]